MRDHLVVERSQSGVGIGMVLGILALMLVVAVIALFAFGGPTRFMGGGPSQTNVNVPAQQQPQSAPNVQLPRQIDVNINQPAQQAPAAPQAPVAPQAPTGGQAPAPSNP